MNLEEQLLKLPVEYTIELLREKCRQDLFFFAKHILGYEDITKYTHGEIVRILESDSKRKLIVCPRGSFKSSLCVVSFSIWKLIRNPNERILIDSEVYGNSKNFIREIKAHLEAPIMKTIFGEFKSFSNWSEGSITISKRTKNFKESSVTAGGIGSEKTGQHYSIIVCDDLNSPKNSGTKEGCEKVFLHFRYLNAILEPDGQMLVIGTRYSANDLIGKIIENEIEPLKGDLDASRGNQKL